MLSCPCGGCPRCPCFARQSCAAYQSWETANKLQKAQLDRQKAVMRGLLEHQQKVHDRIQRKLRR